MPKFKPLPPLERLNELFEVVEIPPDKFGEWSGLVRRVNRGGRRAGSVAGWLLLNSNNPDRADWMVKVDSIDYVVSRVIYFMVYKKDPWDAQVDHRDQNWLNNNAQNLRLDVDGHVQGVNKPMHRNNTSGVMGVSLDKQLGKWRAYVCVENKLKNLGRYTCKVEAARVVNEKWIELGWIEKGRKLNDLEIIECDCESCMSCAPRSGTTVESHPLVESEV